MAKLDILLYPDPRLRQIAKPVEVFDQVLQQLVSDMFETMYDAPGIGLAAIQVNVLKEVIVIDTSPDQSDRLVLTNPVIVDGENRIDVEEGCLSGPGIYAPVERFESIRLEARDADGNGFERQAEGLLAACIQHEMDHLKGKVFVDCLSRLKQDRIRKRLLKEQRERLRQSA